MKYARINFETEQMQGIPVSLPVRWTTPEGSTVSHFDKLSDKALFGLSWLPIFWEERENSEAQYYPAKPVYDNINKRFCYKPIFRDIDELKKQAGLEIDEAASEASAKYISQGVGQESRYQLKREQAIKFVKDPQPIAEDYLMLKREAEETGNTIEKVAQDIIKAANVWLNIASEIEAIRCGGKKKCREALDSVSALQFRDNAISALGNI